MEAKIIAGNFKSNKTRSETMAYLNALDFALDSATLTQNRRIYLFPSICAMRENNFKNFTLGAQNAHFAESGAFTGEATLAHLRDFKISTILIGHSERRNIFGESDEVVAQKFDFFSKHNMEIFLCVGENLPTRKSGKTKDFLRAQLEKINLDYTRLIIAYEPIWAIGTGENASLAQIDEIYKFLKDFTKKQIIYGGSVNERNAGEILRITDGVLVGNASLEVEKFYQIIKGGQK